MSKFKITKIEIENFRSIQSKVILNIKPGLFSIVGVNNDEPASTNGCFTGDTLVKTKNGPKQIKDISKEDILITHCGKKNKFSNTTGSFITKYTKNLIKIVLDSGKEITCTPEHKFVIYNPSLEDDKIIWECDIAYKEAKDLTENDELEPIYYGYIYKITNLINGKIYIGSKKSKFFNFSYWSSSTNQEYWNELDKYGKEYFKREILEWVICENNRQLVECEKKYVKNYLNDHDKSEMYNKCIPASQVLWTKDMLQKRSEKVRGYHCKEETKHKISQALLKRARRLGLNITKKPMYKTREERLKAVSEKLKGHRSWNNWKENGFGTSEFSSKAGKKAWEKNPIEMKQKSIQNIVKYNKSIKGRKESAKRAEHMRNLKNAKSYEEKRIISLKQGLGAIKRKYGIYSEEYNERLLLIREIEPDYNPNETPKERYKRRHENS